MKDLVNIVLASFAFSLVICDSKPEPPTNKYEVENSLKNFCLLFQAAIRLEFKYALEANETIFVSNSTDIPKLDSKTTYQGNCERGNATNIQNLYIQFFNNWRLNLVFEMNATNSRYTLAKINLLYNLKNKELPFPDAKTLVNKSVDIQVNDEWCEKYGSYVCSGRRSYPPMNSNTSGYFIAMEMYNEQYNAFINSTKPEFTANVHRCTGDTISNLIPIVVGAALGGLIIIVLIAYVIGRHRSKKGYESV